MKFLYRILFPALTVLIIFNSPAFAEYIFLKDGSIITGKIETETPVAVSLIKNDGTRQMIYHNNIIRVLYTELYMGRVYVQQTNGKGLEVFMVDEDQEYYTFRHELYKPEEIKIKRTNVLFMARKNPTGLQVIKIETDRIEITWFPPYNQIKNYKIYYKNKESDKYISAGNTSSKSFTIKNLKSNTQYFIIVTAVDKDGYESLPSNEINETTKNIRPNAPKNVKVEKVLSKDKKTLQLNVKWDPAIDPDGKVIEYIIYEYKNKGDKIFARTNKTFYSITALDPLIKRKFFIRAVDDLKDESETAKIRVNERAAVLNIFPGVIFPVGKFGEMYNIGFGGTISFSICNLFFNNFESGIALGFYYMQGKDLLDVKNLLYQDFLFFPVYLTFGYNITIGNSFSIKPLISIGPAYIDMKYNDRNKTIAEGRDRHLQIAAFSFKAGLDAEYRFTDTISVSLGCEYGAIVQNTGLLSFILVNTGIGFSF